MCGQEYHLLKISLLVFGKVGEVLEYVTYTEHGSKNRSGSYKEKRDNKVITHYGDIGEKCYISSAKIPQQTSKVAFKNDKSYWQTKQKTFE